MIVCDQVSHLTIFQLQAFLAKHKINLQLAKINTLGERANGTFPIDGPELQQNKAQIETELLEALV